MSGFTRQQIMAWGAVALAVILIGGNYLRGHLASSGAEAAEPAMTMGLKETEAAQVRIKVHVIGAVVKPGLYEAPAGSRAADAIALAGGATPNADLNQVNLAAKIADGQQLLVPEIGAAPPPAPASGASAAGVSGGSASGATQPVNLNAATQAQLEELDGVGPKTAEKIITYRDSHGGFKSVEELMEVEGIGPAKYDRIKNQVVV